MHKLSRAPNPSTCTQDRINAPHGVESGGLNYPYDLYIVDANGKHIRNLTHDYPTNYLIDRLPDGRILYESVPNDRMRTGRSRIFSINADGTGRRQLASGTGELLPKLSPDGHRILFARGRWLYVMWSDGTHKRRLVQMSFGHYENPTPHVPYDASWSPLGRRIAFVRGFAKQNAYGGPRNSFSAIYVINADGTALRRLTKLRHNVETMNPAWSPYGDKIAFDEYRYPPQLSNSTYVIRADGTHVTRLEPLDAYGEQTWFWFSDDRIAYPAGSGFKSIDPEGTTRPKALPNRVHVGRDLWIASTTDRPPGESWPISPDGKWIAFVGRGLSIEHLDRTHRRLVTRKICCFFGSPAPEWVGN